MSRVATQWRAQYYLGLFARDITAPVPYARTVFASAYPDIEGHKAVFAALYAPTKESHPEYGACVGPFRTKRAALYMARNPQCHDVATAERWAKNEAIDRDMNRRLAAAGFTLPR